MASGDSRPGDDRSGVSFLVHVQVPWNAPESVVTLDSPGGGGFGHLICSGCPEFEDM